MWNYKKVNLLHYAILHNHSQFHGCFQWSSKNAFSFVHAIKHTHDQTNTKLLQNYFTHSHFDKLTRNIYIAYVHISTYLNYIEFFLGCQ
jgi:hypothetical protein